MPQVDVPFPKLGLVRNSQRSNQGGQQQGYYAQFQPESTWNASNVVPYDRNDRLRGGPRGGTLSQATLASPVRAMAQVITYPPQTLTTVWDDVFPGSFTLNQPIEQTAVYSVFRISTTGTPPISAVTPPSDTIVVSAGVQGDKRGTQYTFPAFYRNLTPSAVDNFTATVTHAVATGHTSGVFTYYLRANVASAQGIQFTAIFNGTSVVYNFESFNGNTPAGLGTASIIQVGNIPTTLTYTFTVQGNAISVAENGVPRLSINSSFGAGNTGVGPTPGEAPVNTYTTVSITEHKVTSLTLPSPRQVNLVAVAGGNVYTGKTPAALALVTGGAGAVYPYAVSPQIAYTDGAVYIVDGQSILQVNMTTAAMTTYAATAGTAPVGATLAAIWRGRLVLANVPSFPQNFYMSRVGVATDWDFSQVDPAAAFAGNASTAGHIGEPITALMPFTDDVMLIGGDHNLWRINGDPADGGSIDLVSDAIGVLGPNAWTKDPNGNIWFVGTGGLYKIAPGGLPENVTAKTYNLPFTLIDRTLNIISLLWDRDAQGLMVFFSPISQAVGVHYFYDARNGGLWPMSFPSTHGPSSAIQFDGSSGPGRVKLLGCWDGKVRSFSTTLLNDDGAAITTALAFGPFQVAGPGTDALISNVDVTLGENLAQDGGSVGSINAIVTLRGGKTAYEVTEGTSRHTAARQYTYAGGGFELPMKTRVRGGWFAVELFNNVLDSYFHFEQIGITFQPNGKQR